MKIKILNKDTGNIIFEHSQKNNTMGETVMQAGRDRVDLSYADLSALTNDDWKLDYGWIYFNFTNLSHADLSFNNFHRTSFLNCDLSYVDLSNCSLFNSNFSNSNLTEANLDNSDLRSANLEGVIGISEKYKRK